MCIHNFSFLKQLYTRHIMLVLVALLLLSYIFIVTKNVLWLFLKVSWAGLQCVIVIFPGHTHVSYLKKCKH